MEEEYENETVEIVEIGEREATIREESFNPPIHLPMTTHTKTSKSQIRLFSPPPHQSKQRHPQRNTPPDLEFSLTKGGRYVIGSTPQSDLQIPSLPQGSYLQCDVMLDALRSCFNMRCLSLSKPTRFKLGEGQPLVLSKGLVFALGDNYGVVVEEAFPSHFIHNHSRSFTILQSVGGEWGEGGVGGEGDMGGVDPMEPMEPMELPVEPIPQPRAIITPSLRLRVIDLGSLPDLTPLKEHPNPLSTHIPGHPITIGTTPHTAISLPSPLEETKEIVHNSSIYANYNHQMGACCEEHGEILYEEEEGWVYRDLVRHYPHTGTYILLRSALEFAPHFLISYPKIVKNGLLLLLGDGLRKINANVNTTFNLFTEERDQDKDTNLLNLGQ